MPPKKKQPVPKPKGPPLASRPEKRPAPATIGGAEKRQRLNVEEEEEAPPDNDDDPPPLDNDEISPSVAAMFQTIDERNEARFQTMDDHNEARFLTIEGSQNDQYIHLTDSMQAIKDAIDSLQRQPARPAFQPVHQPTMPTFPPVREPESRQFPPVEPNASQFFPPVPTQGSFYNGNSPYSQLDICAMWPHVDKSLVQAVAEGSFDIYSLPKLHPDDNIRTRNATKTVDGVHLPFVGGAAEVVLKDTKLHSSLRDIGTFYGAWFVYYSIRCHFQPQYYQPMVVWISGIQDFASNSYPWASILKYIVKYFQKHQRSDPSVWFSTDNELHTRTISVPANRQLFQSPSHSPNGRKSEHPLSQQICENYNKEEGACRYGKNCRRKHACRRCKRTGHPEYQCKSPSTPTVSSSSA